jgi:hypothetical protein
VCSSDLTARPRLSEFQEVVDLAGWILDAETGAEGLLNQWLTDFRSSGHLAECRLGVVDQLPQLGLIGRGRVHRLITRDGVAGAIACLELNKRWMISLDFQPEHVDEEPLCGLHVGDVFEGESEARCV